MNKLLTLLFIIFHFVGYSQNWELIQEEEIYYYSRTDSVGIVNTMRVSDINTIGNNIIYTLYGNYLITR